MALEVHVVLSLPRDEMSVSVARHMTDYALRELAVSEGCRGDIALALTEACTNVIEHSSDHHPYEVHIDVTSARCSIRVKDAGGTASDVDLTALEGRSREGRTAAPDAEAGRGIELMRALVDRVAFTAEPEDGMVVHLYKELEFEQSHPVRQRLLS